MDNRVEVIDARATSVTNSPNQIISPYTLVLFNTRRRGHTDFPKGQSHNEQEDSPQVIKLSLRVFPLSAFKGSI